MLLLVFQVDGVSYLLQEIYGIENKYNTQESKVSHSFGKWTTGTPTGQISIPLRVSFLRNIFILFLDFRFFTSCSGIFYTMRMSKCLNNR